jgi:hypothetical protein
MTLADDDYGFFVDISIDDETNKKSQSQTIKNYTVKNMHEHTYYMVDHKYDDYDDYNIYHYDNDGCYNNNINLEKKSSYMQIILGVTIIFGSAWILLLDAKYK